MVIDDDQVICMLLQKYLTKHNFDVEVAHSGKTALEILKEFKPDVVLTDYRMSDMDGSQLLLHIKSVYPTTIVILMTGYSDIKIAIKTIKEGAFDYLSKPLNQEEILKCIRKALESRSINSEEIQTLNPPKKSENKILDTTKYVFGNCKVFKNILDQIALVAPTNYSVIIYGESGSGKESVAHQIHQESMRSNKPFIAIDCGALSQELAMSELFGHEKGAFTGAITQKIGSFELANGGTIFLDEIANLSYSLQIALLRVIQERKIRRLGGVKDIEVDVRIIVASNEKLINKANDGSFREDLYHRFNEFSLEVPSLRERGEDLMMYSHHFLNLTNIELGKNVDSFSDEVKEIFQAYNWPGNLRELHNVIKRATLLSPGRVIEKKVLPPEIYDNQILGNFKQLRNGNLITSAKTAIKQVSNDAEFELILEALKECNYNKSKAAQFLNIDRKTLYNKMKLYKEFNGNF